MTMYRWTGHNGITNYASNPPKNAKNVQEISGVPMYPTVALTSSTEKGIKPQKIKHKKGNSALRLQLQKELVVARLQFASALNSYNKGRIRTGNERNYARYLAKMKMLKNRVSLAEIQELATQKELAKVSNVAHKK